MHNKIVEFQVFSPKNFDDCPLDFQNTIYKLLEKLKREGKKVKVNKTTPIGKAIREDCLTLLKLKLVPDTEKSDFIIKIFDQGLILKNEGINIEIGEHNARIKKIKT